MRISKKDAPVTIAIVGAGGRANGYVRAFEKYFPGQFTIVAVADPIESKRKDYQARYAIPEHLLFEGYAEFLKQPRLADVVILATLDDMHYEPAIGLLELGYDLILEKPIGMTLEETVAIGECAKRHPDQMVAVCHVLRHTPFFRTIKEVIDSKELGEVVDIQHNENVGYFHFAHSYVRGSWRNETISAPFIVAKCCHDFDILLYLLGNKRCLSLSSMGELTFFHSKNYNASTMAPRCLHCPSEKQCPYSALKIYQSGLIKSIVFDLSTPKLIQDTFETSPYGRCVFACDNDVADHQVTALTFEGGIHATFNASAFTKENHRTIKVMCTHGEIRGIGSKRRIEIQRFDEDTPRVIDLPKTEGGHGGGDEGFCIHFMESYLHNKPFDSTIAMSIESHVMAFAADESMQDKGNCIHITDRWQKAIAERRLK